MFDEYKYTFDGIMEEMMQESPDGLNTEEGSLLYNACAKQAVKLEEVYMRLSYLYDNLLPDTQDEDHLPRYGLERGTERKAATNAVVKGSFAQEIEMGTRFECGDFTYIVVENIANYDYKLQCETAGSAANKNTGELLEIDYIDDFAGGSITEILIAGEEEQDIEEYRKEVLSSYNNKEFAGNKKAYKKFIESIDGVAGCKPERRKDGEENVKCTIIAVGNTAPSNELILTVQNLVDPELTAGEGDGLAPIDHVVKIYGVQERSIAIEFSTLFFDTGYSWETIGSYIEAAIDGYFEDLRATWIDANNLIVRISQMEARILMVEGVIDIQGTKLEGSETNIILETNEIPKRGEISGV